MSAFIEHYLEVMEYVQDSWVPLKLLKGLEKTGVIIHVSGPEFFDCVGSPKGLPGGM